MKDYKGNYILESLDKGGNMHNPHIEDGINRLRYYWPQTHAENNATGSHLITVPSVRVPKGWITYVDGKPVDCTICTVLFVAPPGFPAAVPSNFFTDIEMRLASPAGQIPKNTHPAGKQSNAQYLAQLGWSQWAECKWWKWNVQMWNPNQSSLLTFVKSIQQRFQWLT
jgi:hypothetical protein